MGKHIFTKNYFQGLDSLLIFVYCYGDKFIPAYLE